MSSEQYVTSIKRISLLLVVLAVTSCIFTVQNYYQAIDYANSALVHYLFATRHAVGDYKVLPRMKESDLPQISREAGALSYRFESRHFDRAWGQHKEDLRSSAREPAELPPFRDVDIPNAFLVSEIGSRFNPRAPCSVGAFEGSGTELLPVMNFIMVGVFDLVPYSNVRLLKYSDSCEPAHLGMSTILMIETNSNSKNIQLLAIPRRAFRLLLPYDSLAEELFTNVTIKIDSAELLRKQGDVVKRYIKMEDEYTIFPPDFLEFVAFRQARRLTYHLREPSDIEGALEDIAIFSKSSSATLEGVPLSQRTYIAVVPWIVLVAVFLMDQRLGRLLAFDTRIQQPWLLKDSLDWLSRNVARLSTTLPAFCVCVVFLCFALTFNMQLQIGDFFIGPTEILGKPVSEPFEPSLEGEAIYAQALLIGYIAAVFLAVRCGLRLLQVMRTQMA